MKKQKLRGLHRMHPTSVMVSEQVRVALGARFTNIDSRGISVVQSHQLICCWKLSLRRTTWAQLSYIQWPYEGSKIWVFFLFTFSATIPSSPDLGRDIFSLLLACRSTPSPWRCLLACAVEMENCVLAVLAACFQVRVASTKTYRSSYRWVSATHWSYVFFALTYRYTFLD